MSAAYFRRFAGNRAEQRSVAKAVVSLILVSASRPFFLAALRELRLDSAAAVSGRGSQGPAGAYGRKILLRSGEFRCEWVGAERYPQWDRLRTLCRIVERDTE